MSLPSIKKISTKVALSFVLIVLLQGGLSILTLNYLSARALQASLDDQREKTRQLIVNYINDTRKEMVFKAELLAGQGRLTRLLADRDFTTLAAELYFYLKPLKLDAILVVDPEGNRIVNVGNASISNILLKGNPVDLLDRSFATTSTSGVVNVNSEGNKIQLWSLHSMMVNEKRRAILCVAMSLDHAFIGRVEDIAGQGTRMILALRKTILVNGRVDDNVFIEYNRRVAADPDQGNAGTIKSYVYKTTYISEYPELELVYFIDTGPRTTLAALLSSTIRSSLLILAATLVVAFSTSIFLYRYSFQKPFAAFQEAIRRISSGDLSFQFAQGAENEFADLEREFETMTANLRELERELQISSRMAAVGEMVAGVAHQIRNPLAIMKVSAEMIRDAVPASAEPALAGTARTAAQKEKGKAAAARAMPPEANIKPLVDMMLSEIESLGAIVSQFLDFTKPLKVNPEEVEVEEFLARAASLVSSGQYHDREVRISVAEGAERARFDRRLMEQALRNLVANGLHASLPGGELLIGAERIPSRGDGSQGAYRIYVKDEGMGMSDEVKSQLFHPFFTTKSEGTGLGLSIVHRIVEEHGGSVEVSSMLGSGTEFSIVLREGA